MMRLLADLYRSRGVGLWVLYSGLLISFGACAADPLGLSSGPPGVWEWPQVVGLCVGIIASATGAALWLRGRWAHWRTQIWGAIPRWRGQLWARRMDLLVAALLTVVLLGAGAIRFYRCYGGLPYLNSYDEPQTAHTALQMLKSSDFDPQFFNYGSLLIYLNVGVDAVHYFYKMTVVDEPDALRTIDALEVGPFGPWPATGSYRWFVSHPSFYLWNRWLTATFGTGVVLLTYLVGARVYNQVAGLTGAAFLAGLSYHTLHSSKVTTDIPVSFFMLLGLVLSLGYLERKRFRWLVGAACVCGLAIATKYNSAYAILIPMAALISASRGDPLPGRIGRLLALPALAVATFLAAMPYAILNMPTFLNEAGFEIYHYTVNGHGYPSTVQPGLRQLVFQLGNLIINLSLPGMVLSLAGLPLLARSRPGRLLLLLGALNLLLMSRTRVAFHHHLLVIYPIASVAIGCVIALLTRQIRHLYGNRTLRWMLHAVGAALILALAIGALVRSPEVLARIKRDRDTRSLAVDTINNLAAQHQLAGTVIGIASELQIHPLDLRRIDKGLFYTQATTQQLICDQNAYSLLVLPTGATTPLLKRYLATVDPASVTYLRPESERYTRETPLINPPLAITMGEPAPITGGWCDVSVDLASVTTWPIAPMGRYQERPALAMATNGVLTTPLYDLVPGSYSAQLEAGGTPAFDAYPALTISILKRADGMTTTLPVTKEVPLGAAFARSATRFELREPTRIALRVTYANDATDAERGMDRDAYIAALTMVRAAPAWGPRETALLREGLPTLGPTDAAAQPCPAALALLPVEATTASYSSIGAEAWFQVALRGTIQTRPCRLPAGAYGFSWDGRSWPQNALVRATVRAVDPQSGELRQRSSRVLAVSPTISHWYELLELREPATVSLEIEWLDGPAYPGRDNPVIRLPATVQLHPYTQLDVRQALEQTWINLGPDGRGP